MINRPSDVTNFNGLLQSAQAALNNEKDEMDPNVMDAAKELRALLSVSTFSPPGGKRRTILKASVLAPKTHETINYRRIPKICKRLEEINPRQLELNR